MCGGSPKKPTLSTSSSIASLLEGPMTSTEAELLSIYSGSPVDRQSMVSMLSVSTPIAEEPSTANEGNESSSNLRLIADSESTPTATQMNRSYCSEGDLLSTKSPAGTMLSKREGCSLPNIARHIVTTTPRCHRQDGVIRCLMKIPRCIFNRFRPRQNNREQNSELSTTPNPPGLQSPPKLVPFQLLDLTDEPRRLTDNGKRAVIASYSYSLPPVQSIGKEASPTPGNKADQETVKPDLSGLVTSSKSSGLRESGLGDSAIHSPTSTLSSLYSTRVCQPLYTRQPSIESSDTMSVDSASLFSHLSTKRGSYTSHNYVNLNYPIPENPADADVARPEEVYTCYVCACRYQLYNKAPCIS